MATPQFLRRLILCMRAACLATLVACSAPNDQPASSSTASGGMVTPRTPPSASPLPQLATTFTSPLNHYSISMPAGWSVQPATKRWAYPSPGPETPAQGIDILRDPKPTGIAVGTPGWGISAQVIPAQMSDDQWLQWYARSLGTTTTCNPPYSAYQPIVIDGHPGAVHGGLTGCNFTEAVVVANHVGYIIGAYPNLDSHTDQVYPADLFEAMLRTIHLGTT
jgi:hypothetical protein